MVRRRALFIVGIAVLGAAALHWGVADHLPITCPLRRLTGIPCASCGLTRAASALCHGELSGATAYNLAAIPLALATAALLLLLIWEGITQRSIISPLWARHAKVLIWLTVALMLAAWMVNLHHFFQFIHRPSVPCASLQPKPTN